MPSDDARESPVVAEAAAPSGSDAAMGSRRERRRLETRERLYQAAIGLLSERDFDAVTVEMITEAADVGKGTFFNYFASKEAVVRYHFEQDVAKMAGVMHWITQSPESADEEADDLTKMAALCAARPPAVNTPGGPIWRKMTQATELISATETKSKRLERNLLALSLTNEAVRQASLELDIQVCTLLEQVVAQGQQSGEFRTDVAPAVVAEFLSGVYNATLFRWSQSDSDLRFFEMFHESLRMAWRAVRGPSLPE